MPEQKYLSSIYHRSTKPAQSQTAESASHQNATDVTALQRMIGNHAVQRLLAEGHPSVAPRVQTKLHVGAANDSYEAEADNVASAVMSTSDATVQREQEEESEEVMMKRADVQREQEEESEELMTKRAEITIQREAEEDELAMKRADVQREQEEESEELMTKRADVQREGVDMMGEFNVGGSIEEGIRQSAGGGQGLPDTARDFFEPRFGHDFSNVHVHADSGADSLNRSIQARAFTKGSDIYFANGEYQPESSGGRELLAHELTHVIQQTGGSPKRN